MARATWVYLVQNEGTPIAAFTVKHELVAWLKDQAKDNGIKYWQLWLLRDGGGRTRDEVGRRVALDPATWLAGDQKFKETA